ncbi:MAG: UvrD-helicase domain-containing protein [Vulcanimicrobiota bacterium]
MINQHNELQNQIEFTTSQQAAVNFKTGPLLVVAGAGTGKTLCVTHRVADLIKNKIARPEQILVLTFSDKAANEMEERIDLLLPYGFSDVWVSTFHSFGKRVLQKHAIQVGLKPDFQVLAPEEMSLFLYEHIFDLPLDKLRPASNPLFYLKSLMGFISRLKDEDISPGEYLEFTRKMAEKKASGAEKERIEMHLELAKVYEAVEKLKKENGYFDMADLVYFTLKLFRENHWLAEEYQEQFKYLLVDEFQDTNYAQYQLLKILVLKHRNIMVVGDDDQSIYKFRGAAITNILNFMDDYPEAEQIVLTDNFRSSQLILDASYKLITHNNPYRLEVKNNLDKHLRGRQDPDARLSHKVFETEEFQAEAITRLVQKKIEQGYSYNDIGILIRANKNADPIIRDFNLHSIPFNFSGNANLYQRPEVRVLISLLRTIVRPDDSMSFYYLSSSEIYNMDSNLLTWLNLEADRLEIPLEDVFRQIESIPRFGSFNPEFKLEARRIVQDIEKYRELSTTWPVGRVLYQFLSSSGYLNRLARSQVNRAENKTLNISLFFELIRKYQEVSRYPLVFSFVKYLDSLIEAGQEPPAAKMEIEDDAVSIFTVHKAKGLEFPIVIIPGLAEGKFPAGGRGELLDLPPELLKESLPVENFHIQEERRLFYVAMTRAKKELYLMGVRNFGGKRRKKISRFLMEALDVPIKNIKVETPTPEEVIAGFAPADESETASTGVINNSTVSPWQIEDYLNCPLKYKYINVLRIPILRHHKVVYSSALRTTILEYLNRKSNRIPTNLEELYEIFRREWAQEGFLSRQHEEIRFEEGKNVIEKFYEKREKVEETGKLVNKNFSFFFDETKITGNWDVVKPEDGGEVIETFRTSAVRDKKTANSKTRNSLTNKISLLAFENIFKKPARQLETVFLGSGIKGVLLPEKVDFEKVREKMRNAIHGISHRQFRPEPEYFKCSNCAYMEICPATAVKL